MTKTTGSVVSSVISLLGSLGPAAFALATLVATTPAAAAAAAPKVTIGSCTEDLDKAKKAGFDYVELGVRNFAKLSDEDFAKYEEKHKAAGIPTPVGNNFIPSDIKVVGPDTDKAKQMEYVNKAFDRAKKLGLKTIVFGSGGARKVPDGFSQDEAWKQLVEFAKRIAPEAKKRGIVVAVEPLQKGETNTINSAAEGLKWVKAVNHPNFQLMVDFYHLSLESESPDILVTGKKNIKHFHIANPVGRKYPMSSEEFDYSKFFANLKKIGYRGGISVEGRTSDYDGEGPKALAFLRAAVAEGVKPPSTPPPPARPPGNDAPKAAAAPAGGATPTAGAPPPPPAAPAAPAAPSAAK
jgi:D-psicose/D-tagatose/L-ribulose 3-epimerase